MPLLEASEQAIDNGNSLIVKTTADRLPKIQALVQKLDTPLANLIITVVQSHYQTASELNAAAAVDITTAPNSLGRSSASMHGFLADTERFKEGESRQQVRTVEGRPAYIKSGRLHPIHNIGIYNSGYGYPAVTTETQFIEASSGFMVVPRLTGRQVMLEVSPWTDTINRSGGIDTQGAHTQLRTTLGTWVEIGAIDSGGQTQQQGWLKHSRSTKQHTLRLLLKVDRVD